MKIASILLFGSLTMSADAVGVRELITKMKKANKATAADTSNNAAAIDADAAASVVDEEQRKLQNNGCWSGNNPTKAWHPTYSAGWTNGYCQYTVDCNSPSYSNELSCCKSAYGGQISGECLSRLPNPPTTSPTGTGGLAVYYPDYTKAWPEGYCINSRPMPSGRPTYSTMLACCKGAYGGQMSGKCLASLPSPPTTSPTKAGGVTDFWYPDYDTAWSDAGCKNIFPLPYNNVNDRPNYSTQMACCKGAYGGQMSGVCVSQLPSPPTTTPTGTGGLDFYYPDYDTAWSDATCKNERPLPYNNKNDRPSYSTMLACCKGAYSGQTSGSCLAALPSPPTTSPTSSGGLAVYYPNYSAAWPEGTCINDRPLPSGRPTYSSKGSCCSLAYGGQTSNKCQCDAVGICYACNCGTQAERVAAGGCPQLVCA